MAECSMRMKSGAAWFYRGVYVALPHVAVSGILRGLIIE